MFPDFLPVRRLALPCTALIAWPLLAAAPAFAADDVSAPAADEAEPAWYSLHIQGTYTTQGHPRFHSAIPDGPQSMKAQEQMAETADVTLYAGVRLGGLEFYASGLSPCFRRNQHLVGDRLDGEADAQQGAEGGMGRLAAIEAEDELVEVGLEMLAA